MPIYRSVNVINDAAATNLYTLSLHDALPISASWLLNALLRIFAMSIITPKRKVLRMSVQDCWRPPLRSEERFSRNAETELVCRLLLEKKKVYGIDIDGSVYARKIVLNYKRGKGAAIT